MGKYTIWGRTLDGEIYLKLSCSPLHYHHHTEHILHWRHPIPHILRRQVHPRNRNKAVRARTWISAIALIIGLFRILTAVSAVRTERRFHHDFRFKALSLGIMAPDTAKRASFQEEGHPTARAVMHRKFANIKNSSCLHTVRSDMPVLQSHDPDIPCPAR